MAIKYHKTALDSFAETRQELQKGCNQILANNQLLWVTLSIILYFQQEKSWNILFNFRTLVDSLKEHLIKVESLKDKNLYPTLKNKKCDLIRALNAAVKMINGFLNKTRLIYFYVTAN